MLLKNGVFFFRVNNQPVFDPKLNSGYGGYRTMGKYALPGVPDIIVIPEDGIFTGIEVKGESGRQSPEQVLFEKRAKRHNARYMVAKSVEEVKDFLNIE